MSDRFAGSIFDKETPHTIIVSRICGFTIAAACVIAGFAIMFL